MLCILYYVVVWYGCIGDVMSLYVNVSCETL